MTFSIKLSPGRRVARVSGGISFLLVAYLRFFLLFVTITIKKYKNTL